MISTNWRRFHKQYLQVLDHKGTKTCRYIKIFNRLICCKLNNYVHFKGRLNSLTDIDSTTIYQQLTGCSGYWYIVIKNQVNTMKSDDIPVLLIEYVRQILQDIAIGKMAHNAIPEPTLTLIGKVNDSDITTVIDEIIDNICNNVSSYTISTQKFIYFESKFRTLGKLKERCDGAVPCILKPVLNDNTCRELILSNTDFYAKIVNDSKNSSDFIREIKALLESSPSDTLTKFAKKINVSIKSETTNT